VALFHTTDVVVVLLAATHRGGNADRIVMDMPDDRYDAVHAYVKAHGLLQQVGQMARPTRAGRRFIRNHTL